jgi:hypothetical protein
MDVSCRTLIVGGTSALVGAGVGNAVNGAFGEVTPVDKFTLTRPRTDG